MSDLEIIDKAHRLPALAAQLARRKTVAGRDQLIMRVESSLEDVAHIREVVLAVLRLNHHLGRPCSAVMRTPRSPCR